MAVVGSKGVGAGADGADGEVEKLSCGSCEGVEVEVLGFLPVNMSQLEGISMHAR